MISNESNKSEDRMDQSLTPSDDKDKQPHLTHKLSTSSSSSSPKNGPPLMSTISYPYHMSPSTIPGVLHLSNYGAIDWSMNDLVAYGSQNRIVIVDTNSMTYCQTLHRHKHIVCCLKWSPVNNSQLASVDISGVIIVWNVIESTPLTVILASNETKVVSFFNWIYLDKNTDLSVSSLKLFDKMGPNDPKFEATTYKSNLPKTLFLLAFYQQTNCFILYDAELGEPVVKWAVDYKVTHVAFNPFFTFNRSCDLSVSNLLLGLKPSQSNEDKLYFALARLSESDFVNDEASKEPRKVNLSFSTYMLQSSTLDTSNKTNNRVLRYDLITPLEISKLAQHLASSNETTSHNNSSTTNSATNLNESYIQVEFHKSVRNQIFIVFPRDIYLIDLSIETIINVIPLERNCSKIVKIFSCGHRNSFYAFHESGNVSFRLYQKKIIHDRSNINQNNITEKISNSEKGPGRLESFTNNSNLLSFLNVGYINLCQSESIRLTKQNKIFCYALSPFDETRVAFLLSSGRIVIKSLICQKTLQHDSSPASMGYVVNQSLAAPCLGDLIKPQEYQLGAFLVSDSAGQLKSFDSIFYKILVTQFITGLNSLPTVVRMCPPLTLQNIKKHRPLLAVGDSLGLIQIWLLRGNSSVLHREFSVHSYPVTGIEWTGLHSLISFSYPTINSPSHSSSSNNPFSALSIVTGSGSSSGKVTNELVFIDIETGKVTQFRTNRVHDSSPIETIRVSHLKQYLIILFKHDDPFEIWDVRNLTLLRVMSKNMTNITAVEWSPLYNKRQVSRNSEVSDSDTSQHSAPPYVPLKENFIVTNRNLFHFCIEGNLVREMSCIPPDADSGHVTVTSIAWKSDQVLLGDASGTLNLWHLKRKVSATEPTFRGYIRKIRFGPGRGNMKCLILYADFGVDIWDINDFRVCAQLKYPRDMNFKIIDVDWATCDLPILCTAEGFIFVTDTKLKTYSSPISLKEVDTSLLSKMFSNPDDSEFETFFNLNSNTSINFINLEFRKEILKQSIFTLPQKLKKDEEETDTEPSPVSTNVDIRNYINSQILLSKLLANTSDFDFWNILYSILYSEELDSRLDLFLDAKHFRHLQQEKLLLLECNRKTYSHACYAYQMNLQLKNFQRAVQILLETESFQHANGGKEVNAENVFYVDALKACLIASLQSDMTKSSRPVSNHLASNDDSCGEAADLDNNSISNDNFDDNSEASSKGGHKDAVAPVVKLVATSLIANGHILEGVELLNFISKTSDSCRYLQSAEKWLESIWLAKSSLDTNECNEVIRRWCELLIASKYYSDKQTAFKMYLSRRQFSRVLRSLNRLSELKAFPFALVCVAAQLIDIDANSDVLEEIFDKFATRFYGYDEATLTSLKKSTTDQTVSGDEPTTESLKDNSNMSAGESVLRQFWSLFTAAPVTI